MAFSPHSPNSCVMVGSSERGSSVPLICPTFMLAQFQKRKCRELIPACLESELHEELSATNN